MPCGQNNTHALETKIIEHHMPYKNVEIQSTKSHPQNQKCNHRTRKKGRKKVCSYFHTAAYLASAWGCTWPENLSPNPSTSSNCTPMDASLLTMATKLSNSINKRSCSLPQHAVHESSCRERGQDPSKHRFTRMTNVRCCL